jgi:hypothetical protein
LMLNSPNIPDYADLAAVINYMYASKHGYNFVVHKCPRESDIKKDWMWDGKNEYLLVWSKPTIVKQYLQYFDYVLFIDSDAMVDDHNQTVESFVQQHMRDPNTLLLWAEDCLDKSYCWSPNTGNTGVMIFKRDPKTFELLDAWHKSPDTELCSAFKYEHPREQKCLQELMTQSIYKQNIKMLPYDTMNGKDGKWIKHFMGTTRDERTAALKNKMCSMVGPFCTSDKPRFIETFSGSFSGSLSGGGRNGDSVNLWAMVMLLVILIVMIVVASRWA